MSITYQVKQLAAPGTVREFDCPEEAIRAAVDYDHEYEVWLHDSQGGDVRFAYCWLNKVHVSGIASGDFIDAAKSVCSVWPYQLA